MEAIAFVCAAAKSYIGSVESGTDEQVLQRRKNMKTTENFRLPAMIILLTAAGLLTAEAAFVELRNGRTMQGTSIRSRSNGDVILTPVLGDV